MQFELNIFNRHVHQFYNIANRILRKNASANHVKIAAREYIIIQTYNKLIDQYKLSEGEIRNRVETKILSVGKHLGKCLEKLGSSFRVVDYLSNISIEKPHYYGIFQNKFEKELMEETEAASQGDTQPNRDDIIANPIVNPTPNMANTFDYISNLSRVIKDTYDGDPIKLPAFISSIELAEAASNADQQTTLVKFIKSKLIGKALEVITPELDTATKIVDALKAKIKPESTSVVMGRLLALRAEKTSMQKFQEAADALADSLRRSYISDGVPHDLAMKMTIDRTVEMCRLSARTPLVKSVLASATFAEPKEVLAKFITESNQETTETRILAYGNGNNNNNANNNRGRGNFRGQRNYGYNNYNNANNYNNRGNQNFNQRGNFRGRRGGRGRGFFNNNRGGYARNNNNNGRNEQYIRIVSENGQGPSNERADQNQNGAPNPNEHVIRIARN